ncbi:MAG: bifunctional folylpolyglutamate synthase/dihydrofolate synthase [Ruminococcus sp.]|nr:bifunctional folylpolyglutamate synthase/dihydrofolate synthase [Ruminococcus sp.]
MNSIESMSAIEKIHSLDAFGSRPGLDRIKRFLEILGNPQDKLKFVHVAGTNGKGSTCQLLSSVLTEAGYKTGLFISPYIVDFRERIQINGEMISEEILEDAVERTFPILLRLREEDCIITEFEYVMALEFLIHSEAGCDVVVLETGMGGLLDCTNVILPPLCSVITKIGLDHTAVLGDTIEEIAAQKCGIIKSGSLAITSPQCIEAMRVIEADCKDKNVGLIKSENIEIEIISENIYSTKFRYNGIEIELPLIGEHQIENAKTALAAIEVLKKTLGISDSDIVEGFKKAKNPARFELLSENPMVILDGAHNPDGINALKNALIKYNDKSSVICVLGMLSDKDSKSSIRLLSGLFKTVYTVTVNNPRTLSAEKLAEECEPYFDEVHACVSVQTAINNALEYARKNNSLVVIAGSLYLAGEARKLIVKS